MLPLRSLLQLVRIYAARGSVLAVVHTSGEADWIKQRLDKTYKAKCIYPGTTAMGFRADYIIVHGLDEEADERTLAWFNEAVRQRLTPGGQVLRVGYVIR